MHVSLFSCFPLMKYNKIYFYIYYHISSFNYVYNHSTKVLIHFAFEKEMKNNPTYVVGI